MKNQPSNPKNEPKEDFWDLGDDDLELEKVPDDPPVVPAPAPAPAETIQPFPVESVPSGPLGELDDDEPTSAGAVPSPPSETEPERKRVRVKSSKDDSPPTTAMEKALLATVTACLLGITAWGTKAFFDNAPNGILVEFQEDYPAKGEQVTVAKVETWWREPVRSGDNPDIGVVIDAELIPCAKIKLAESGSTTIQVSFRDGDDKLIGDTRNLIVKNGKFVLNDSDEIDIHATAGFTNPSLINSYIIQDIAPWSVAIVEGSSSDTPLVRARIEANRKENK